MRLDVAVNLLAMQALEKGSSRFGERLVRPNIHIDDIADLYEFLRPPNVTGVFNAGFENISIKDIANMVVSEIGGDIVFKPSNDPRSYRSTQTNCPVDLFKKNVASAIRGRIAYNEKLCPTRISHNLKWMKQYTQIRCCKPRQTNYDSAEFYPGKMLQTPLVTVHCDKRRLICPQKTYFGIGR